MVQDRYERSPRPQKIYRFPNKCGNCYASDLEFKRLGMVVDTSMNQEGLFRAVKVMLGSRNPQKGSHAKCSVVERPVQNVVLLMQGVD